MSLVRSIDSASFPFPRLLLWERPKGASLSSSRENPGCLEQGPEEKLGLVGFTVGFMTFTPFYPKYVL
jgi:hypothetical protein